MGLVGLVVLAVMAVVPSFATGATQSRKKAIWGWLGFVVVVFMAGNMVGTTQISDVDQFSGESHRAEVALKDSGDRDGAKKQLELVVAAKGDFKEKAEAQKVLDALSKGS